MKLISTIICFFFSLLFAQMDTVENVFTYQSEIPNVERLCGIIKYSDNEFVIATDIQSNGNTLGILKVNSDGEVLSSYYDEVFSYEYFQDIRKAQDEGFYVLNRSKLLKFNSENEIIWEYTFSEFGGNGNKYFYVHPDGNISVTGGTAYVLLLDSDGNDNSISVSGTEGLGYHIGTSDEGFLFHSDNTIYKTDENGEVNWEFVTGFQYLSGFIETDMNEYILYGRDYCSDGTCTSIRKVNSQGELIWSQVYNDISGGAELGRKAILQINGGYIFGGSKSWNGGTRSILLRINGDGDELWQYESNNSSNTVSYMLDLVSLSDNKVFAVGHHYPSDDLALTIWDYHFENHPPTILDIPNQEINEDENLSYEIDFSLGSGENISITANSDNNNVDVSIDDYILLIQPLENWSGNANIEIMIVDENFLFDETEFSLTVNAVNDPPQEFDLIYPTLSDTLIVNTDTDDAYSFFWEASEDVDNDVTYTMTITLDYFGDIYSETYESNDTTIMVSGYEWAVLMTNLNLQRWSLEYIVESTDGEYTVESEVGEFVFENNALSVDEGITPIKFNLHQNHPNPFNPITTIRYDLPEATNVTISIYDMMGRKVRNLINSNQISGYKSVIWNGTNDNGELVSGGMYFYSIRTNTYSQTKKMILLK